MQDQRDDDAGLINNESVYKKLRVQNMPYLVTRDKNP